MKIIIVGCGKVGYAIAQQLTQEKHDITVVDDEAAHLNRADSTLDVLCIHGNGASISVLMEAGARDADLVIAVTGVDETNLGVRADRQKRGRAAHHCPGAEPGIPAGRGYAQEGDRPGYGHQP